MKTKRLFNNWKLKLAAVGIAALVWIMIMSFSDPPDTVTFSNVPITITNGDIFSEAGKSYTVDGRLYTAVRVTGANSVVHNLSSSDFTATADLSQMYDVTGRVPVSVVCTAREASRISFTPVTAALKINVEDVKTKHFDVKVDTVGEVAEGYLLGEVRPDPDGITVKAPVSVIERIADVRVSVDLDGLTDNAEFTCKPVYYSSIGAAIDFGDAKDTSFSEDEVKVAVEIWTMKTVPVVINVAGQDEVASGYRYTGAQQSATAVKVSGLRSRLATLNSVTIPDTDLSVADASADVSVNIDLRNYLPDGIDLVEGEEPILTVTLQVAPLIVKTYEVETVSLEGTNSNYGYEIENLPIHIQLRALEEDFKGITDQHITATLDVAGYGPGSYSLPVHIELDSVFEMLGSARANLIVSDKTAPTPSETEQVLEEDE